MGCHCFKSQQPFPEHLQHTNTNEFSQRSASTNRVDIKLKYKNLIQNETTNIKKKINTNMMITPGSTLMGVNMSEQSLKQAQWLKYVKQELQAISDEAEWAYPLLAYIKSKFKGDHIQQITFKILSDYFWTQYQQAETMITENTRQKSPKQQHNQYSKYNLSEETKPIFLSPQNKANKNRFTVMSPNPDMQFNQQLDLKNQQSKQNQHHHHQSVKLTIKSLLVDENGQDALRLSSKFNRRVLKIRDQIQDSKHPINKLIKRFDNQFFHQYAPVIERTGQQSNKNDSKEQMNRIVKEVQNFVRIIFFATIKFYRLDFKPNDIRKDLVINMITSVIMKDQTYSIIMNSILQGNQDRVRTIQKNMSKYKFKINLDKLGVSKYFQFSKAFKDLINQTEGTQSKLAKNMTIKNNQQAQLEDIKFDKDDMHSTPGRTKSQTFSKRKRKNSQMQRDNNKPFEKTIESLKDIPEINSPMKKLEYIYQIFNSLMIGEIDEFWDQVNVDPRKLEIDYENLNGIAIYIALKAALPILIVDIIYIENFVSNTILNTNRAYQMTVLHSALTFIEENLPSYYEQKDKKNPLKENFTPRFITNDSVLLSPRSVGASAISKLGQSFNQLSSAQTVNEEFDLKKDEDLLFCMEEVTLDSKREKDNISKQRRNSSEFIDNIKNSSQYRKQREEFSNILSYSRHQCNIHPNAARTIHKMLNQKLHLQSFIGHQHRSPSEFTSNPNIVQTYKQNILGNDNYQLPNFQPQSHKQLWNLNIYFDYDKLMSTYQINTNNPNHPNNEQGNQAQDDNIILFDKELDHTQYSQDNYKQVQSYQEESPQIFQEYEDNSKIVITEQYD